jgi:hypothetical protein
MRSTKRIGPALILHVLLFYLNIINTNIVINTNLNLIQESKASMLMKQNKNPWAEKKFFSLNCKLGKFLVEFNRTNNMEIVARYR